MTDPLRIRIRSDWDTALTYESLDEQSENRAVFVGRDTLIAPLVAEIVEPNKRGTFCVCGRPIFHQAQLEQQCLST